MRLKRDPDTATVISPTPRLLFLLLPLLALCWACGPDPLQGRVVLSGSSTVAPLLARTTQQWKSLHPQVEVRVEGIGSDAGLERLIRFDDADLALLSRPLSAQDDEAANAVGKTLLALPLAWDAVSIVVPTSNTWALSLTRAQVVQAFTSATLWSDLDPSWPALPVHRFVLGPNSGTADIFARALLDGNKSLLFTAGAQSSEDDGILARGVSQVDGAVGFLGWTSVNELKLPLRTVALENRQPTMQTIHDGTYGLPRELWVVVNLTRWNRQPAVQSLVRYLYDGYPAVLAGSSLVPLSAQELESVQSRLRNPLQ